MRPLFGVLILLFVLFLSEIEETSGLLKRIFTKNKSSNDDEDARAVSIYGTSRLTTPWPPKNNPTSKSHEALDLQESQPYVTGPYRQQGLAEGSDQPQGRPRQKSTDWSNQHFRNRAPAVPELVTSHERPNVQNLKKPTNIPEGQGKKSNRISVDLSRDVTHDSPTQIDFDKFMRAPFLKGPYSPSGQESVDLFNKHYGQKAKLPVKSEKKALELYESYQNRHVPDLNSSVDTEGKGRQRRSKKEE